VVSSPGHRLVGVCFMTSSLCDVVTVLTYSSEREDLLAALHPRRLLLPRPRGDAHTSVCSRCLGTVSSCSQQYLLKVRISGSSIKCLDVCFIMFLWTKPFDFQVLPFRTRVLRALARPLDDRKRLVRRAAVRARTDWYVVVLLLLRFPHSSSSSFSSLFFVFIFLTLLLLRFPQSCSSSSLFFVYFSLTLFPLLLCFPQSFSPCSCCCSSSSSRFFVFFFVFLNLLVVLLVLLLCFVVRHKYSLSCFFLTGSCWEVLEEVDSAPETQPVSSWKNTQWESGTSWTRRCPPAPLWIFQHPSILITHLFS